MTILDTNVWVAYLNKDDSQHAKAVKVFEAMLPKSVILPEYVILETVTILAQRASKKTADRFLDSVLDNQDITVLYAYRELFAQSIAVFQQQGGAKLSFVDAALVALAGQYQVITFDRALAKAITVALK